MKTDTQKIKGQAELSTQKKLEQIKSGGKTLRTTGGEKKNIVITGRDGSKVIQQQKEEKFEETGVTRKKRNYVMYEAKIGTETTTDITKIDAPRPLPKPKTPKPLRAPEPRIEEKIIIKKKRREYLDNYQYHETKDIKNPNPRFHVYVEHKRLGDVIGGTFEETSYQRQVFAQGSNRPKITEKKTKITTTGTANQPKLNTNKSEALLKKANMPGGDKSSTTTTKTTTTRTTRQRGGNPKTATGGKEKITETSVKNRREGTGSKTETRTEKKTTTTGTRGGETSSSTTTKTTTKTTSNADGGAATSETKTTSTTTKTTTTTTKTEGDEGKSETKTETKTEKTESSGGAGGSIRMKYSKKK